jgi:hypothetical protein
VREIKFRAWDKTWKRWIDPRDINFYGEMDWMFDRRSAEGGDVIESADLREVELMQFTGLKDQMGLGTDVYESDILKVLGETFEVNFANGSFWAKNLRTFDAFPLWKTLSNGAEVIGNIYESPEILKKERA